jgi:hypothetical protein
MINDAVPLFGILDFVVPAEFPFRRMIYNSGPDHVRHVDQMIITFNCGGVESIRL